MNSKNTHDSSKIINQIHTLFSKLSASEQKDTLSILSRHKALVYPVVNQNITMLWNNFFIKNRKTMNVIYEYVESYENKKNSTGLSYECPMYTCIMKVSNKNDDKKQERQFTSRSSLNKKEARKSAIKMAIESGYYSI